MCPQNNPAANLLQCTISEFIHTRSGSRVGFRPPDQSPRRAAGQGCRSTLFAPGGGVNLNRSSGTGSFTLIVVKTALEPAWSSRKIRLSVLSIHQVYAAGSR